MRASSVLPLLACASSCLFKIVAANAVFAHYMLGTVSQAHAEQDIDDAMAMGLDAFALNIGDATESFVGDSLSYLFNHAAAVGFKLYISMDLYAAGDACYKGRTSCNDVQDYAGYLSQYLGHSAYYRAGAYNNPMISTFSSGGKWIGNFTDFRNRWGNTMYFIPDFDETAGYYEGADDWYDYWGDVVEGIFSWESAWPVVSATDVGDVSKDITAMAAATAHGKDYMIGLSFLQYKNAYGTNLYRQGELNFPARMKSILGMSPRPAFVQVQTWNDGPEAHYFGNLWDEQNTDAQPMRYATQVGASHTGLQPLITSFINAYKSGGSASSMRPPGSDPIGAIWYKTILQSTVCPGDSSSQDYFHKPNGSATGSDQLNWAIVVPEGVNWEATLTSGGIQVQSNIALTAGLNYGSTATVNAGAQVLVVYDGYGNEVAWTENQRCITSGCTDGIYNYNPQVSALVTASTASKKRDAGNATHPLSIRDADYTCWQCQGVAVLDTVNAQVTGLSYGPYADAGTSTYSCDEIKGVNVNQGQYLTLEVTDQFAGWFGANAQTTTWLSTFTTPMGIGQSHGSCAIVNENCGRIDCNNLDTHAQAGSGWQYLTTLSAMNLNMYLGTLYSAVDSGLTLFNTNKEALDVLFFESTPASTTLIKEILLGFASAVSILASFVATPIVAAEATTAMISAGFISGLVGGIVGGVDTGAFNAGSQTLADMAAFEQIVSGFSITLKTELESANTYLVDTTGYYYPAPDYKQYWVVDLFDGGAWVDYTKIRYLDTTVRTPAAITDLSVFYYNMMAAQVGNYAWQKQGLYLACYPMTQAEFDSFSGITLDAGLSTYVRSSGQGCWWQAAKYISDLGNPNNRNAVPFNWAKFPDTGTNVNWDLNNVVESSWSSFVFGGQKTAVGDIVNAYSSLMTEVSTTMDDNYSQTGLFQVPICSVDPSYAAGGISSVAEFFATIQKAGDCASCQPAFCGCLGRTDQKGIAIEDVYTDITKLNFSL